MFVNHSEIATLIGATTVMFLYSLLFIFLGLSFLKNILKKHANDYLMISMSFFLGSAAFLALWCNLETLVNRADIALMISTLIFIAVIFYCKEFNFKWLFKPLFKLTSPIAICLLIITSLAFLCARILPQDFNIGAHIGSGSSMLYFNKTLFYYLNNDIPRSTNSIGQTLLAAIPLFFTFAKSGLWNLFTWIYICIIFYSLFIYGFLKEINFSRRNCWIGTFFLLFGTASFSILPTNVIDSGMPIVTVLYAHSLITIITFFTYLIFGYYYLNNNLKINLSFLVLSFLIIASWFITCPENILIGFPAAILYFGWLYFKGNLQFKKIASISLFIMGASFVGVSRGGLLSPAMFRDIQVERTIPGFQDSPVGQPFSFKHPGVDYSITIAPAIFALQYPTGQRFHLTNREQEAIIPYEFNGTWSHKIFAKIYSDSAKKDAARILLYESELWNSFRIFLIPILGMVALFWYTRLHKENTLLYQFSVASAILFVGGFILTFVPYQTGLKWPFTRFLLPGIIPAQLSFYIAFILIFEKLSIAQKPKQAVFIGILFILTIGQIIGLTASATSNATAISPSGENIITRGTRMVSTDYFVL